MAKKKLKLNDLKLKSFVTTLDVEEQRTAKGGYIVLPSQGQFGGRNQWTSQKTRLRESGKQTTKLKFKNTL